MAKFFHFEGSVHDEVIDLTDICKITKCHTQNYYIIQLYNPMINNSDVFFKNKEERDASYEKLKQFLLAN